LEADSALLNVIDACATLWKAYAPHYRRGPASAFGGRQCRIERFARPHHRRGHVAVGRVVAADVHRLALRLGEFGHDDVFVLGQRFGPALPLALRLIALGRTAPSTEGEKESAAFAELVRLISAEARQTPSPTGFFGTGRRRQPPRAGSAAKLNPSRE